MIETRLNPELITASGHIMHGSGPDAGIQPRNVNTLNLIHKLHRSFIRYLMLEK